MAALVIDALLTGRDEQPKGRQPSQATSLADDDLLQRSRSQEALTPQGQDLLQRMVQQTTQRLESDKRSASLPPPAVEERVEADH